jgi:hypothetical protein
MTVDVEPAEYWRLLGYPPGTAPSERALELAAWAGEWYEAHGRPWSYERMVERSALAPFGSARLQQTLDQADADAVALVAVSAGEELEAEAQQRWREEKPDEYFFLEVFGSAVVEQLLTTAGARLCARAEEQHMAVLPHYSPGYGEWDIAEQGRLLELIGPALPGRLEALESGALRPKKSQLAVFGLTRQTDGVRRLTEMVACENCCFGPCQFRRAPYRPARQYTTNLKALRRWTAERLSLQTEEDGSVRARFRYDGTTCTNIGQPLAFDYRVRLGPRAEGYPIREQSCGPAAGDKGHRSMCRYIDDADVLMSAIGREKPLDGRPLGAVLAWKRAANLSGCYCEASARDHKWGLVLETIHYALHS